MVCEIELDNDQSQNLTLDKFGVEILLNQTDQSENLTSLELRILQKAMQYPFNVLCCILYV